MLLPQAGMPLDLIPCLMIQNSAAGFPPTPSQDLCREVIVNPSAQWAEIGRECVKTPSRTLAMISEDFIAGIALEALHPR